jgi:hypothetical protein
MKIRTENSSSGNRYITVKGYWIFKKYFNYNTGKWDSKFKYEKNKIDYVIDRRRSDDSLLQQRNSR